MIDTSKLRTTVELLDLVRDLLKRSGKPDSDYQVHKALGVSTQTVSNWRTGRRGMEDDTGLVVAKMLEIPQEYVMACLYVERAKSDATRAFWRDLALRSARAVALVAAVFLPAYLEAAISVPCRGICILCSIRRGVGFGEIGRFDIEATAPAMPAARTGKNNRPSGHSRRSSALVRTDGDNQRPAYRKKLWKNLT